MGPGFFDGLWKGFMVMLVLAAIVGWAVIEGGLWLVRHIRLEWVS